MLALGEAAFGAGGSHSGVGDLGVTQSGNYDLRREDFTASRAMLALGEAAFGAGGSHGGVGDLGVTQSGDGGLLNQNFTASRAMLALGETRFGTGGSHGGVGDLGVRMLGGGAYSFGKNHLAVRAKGVATNGNGRAIGEGHAAYVGRAQVQGHASGDLIAVVDEVVISLKLHQLVAGLLDVLDVEIITDDTVLHLGNHHLALGVKLVGARGDGTAVGEGHSVDVGCAQRQAFVLGDLVPVIDEVEISVLVLYETVGILTDSVHIEIVVMGAGKQGGYTVGAAIVVDGLVGGKIPHKACLHVAVPIEQVGLSVDLVGLGGGDFGGRIPIVAGAVPVAGARGGSDPDTACEAAVFKEELHTAVGVLAAVQTRVGGLVEVVPLVVDRLPAAQQLAVDQIVGLITHELKPRAVKGHTAVRTDQLVALDGVDMTRSGEDGSPAHHRAAHGAGGSAGVARLKGGGSLVGHRHDGVLVEACAVCHASVDPILRARHGILGGVVEEQLGIHQNVSHTEGAEGIRFAVGGVGDLTLHQSNLHALRPDVALQDLSRGGLIRLGDPGANGNGGQDRLTRGGVLPRTGDDDGSDIVVSLDGVGSGEACGDGHALQLPDTAVVEIQRKLHLVDRLDVGGHEIHPVERTDEQAVGGGIAGDELNRGRIRVAVHADSTVDPGRIAVLVGNLELDRMGAVGKCHARDGDPAVRVDAGNLHTVDIGLRGFGIHAACVGEGGIIGHGDLENGGIPVNSLSLHGRGATRDRHRGSREDRRAVIRDCIGVVQGDLVDVEGEVPVQVGRVSAARGVVDGEIDVGDGVSRNRSGDVVPALVQGGEIVACETAVTELHRGVAGIARDVEPEAHGGRSRAVNGGEGHLQGMRSCTADLGIVTVDRKNMVSVLALTAASSHDVELAHGIAADGVDRPACQLPSFGVSRELVLKGVGELGAFAETNGRGSGDTAHLGGQGGGQRREILLPRGEVKAVDGANARSGQGKGHVRGLKGDGMALKGSVQAEIHTAAKGNRHVGGGEGESVGGDDMEGLFTNHLAVHGHLHRYGSLLAVGEEQALLGDAAEGAVGQPPDGICGDIGGGTAVIHAGGVELDRAAGGVVIGIGGNTGFLKLTRGGSGGDDEDTVGGGALNAVGGGAMERQLLTGALGQEGGGSAAVTVHGLHTTEGDHELRHLVAVEAPGEGLLTALVHDGDDGSVRLDAQHGAGSGRLGVIDDMLIFPVLDQEMEAGGDQLLFPARNGVVGLPHLGLGDMGRTGYTVLLVKIDHQAGIGTEEAVLAVSEILAVHDERAQRLADQLGMLRVVIDIIPMQGCIHGGDHVAVAVLLGVLGLLGHDLGAVIPRLDAFRHALVAGQNLGVRVIGIHLHHVAHLPLRAVLFSQNDLRLGDTGSQLPVSLGDHFEIVTPVLRILNGKCGQGNCADEHKYAQKRGGHLCQKCFFHNPAPFLHL